MGSFENILAAFLEMKKLHLACQLYHNLDFKCIHFVTFLSHF